MRFVSELSQSSFSQCFADDYGPGKMRATTGAGCAMQAQDDVQEAD
jgi:hypothetical protein